MPENLYLQNYNIPEDGVLVEYRTTGEYTPAHWHDSLELVYILTTVSRLGEAGDWLPEFNQISLRDIERRDCATQYRISL